MLKRCALKTRSSFFRLLIDLVDVQSFCSGFLAQLLKIVYCRGFGQICNCDDLVVGAGSLLNDIATLIFSNDILESIIEFFNDCNLLIVEVDFMFIDDAQKSS